MPMFYACSSSLSVPVSVAVDVLTSVGAFFIFLSMRTPYSMHVDAHCRVGVSIIGREREKTGCVVHARTP